MIRRCKICDKEFSAYGAQKYCSRGCAISAAFNKRQRIAVSSKDTICWVCKNATGNCSWSRSLKPVEGWKAKKTKILIRRVIGKVEYEDSYIVKTCPQYQEG